MPLYTGVTPKHPFDPRNGHWGALQLVARYADLDVDNKAFPIFANPADFRFGSEGLGGGLELVSQQKHSCEHEFFAHHFRW